MKKQFLASGWEISFIHPSPFPGPRHPDAVTLPAVVPGNAAVDLMRAGILPDLFTGARVELAKEWERTDFTYSTAFSVAAGDLGKKLSLVFEGVDTAARIVLNGNEIGFIDNMFIPHTMEVSGKVREQNTLLVHIENPIGYSARLAEEHGFDGVELSHLWDHEALYLRKAQHMFGWDIAPRILIGGIWRPVHLDIHEETELKPEEFYFHTLKVDRQKNEAELGFQWAVGLDPKTDWRQYAIHVRGVCDGTIFEHRFGIHFTHGKETITIPNPRLWWPRGCGKADLYDVEISLLYQGRKVDSHSFRLGIRTLHLDFHEDAHSRDHDLFAFVCNGEKIFVRGSNWVPADALHGKDAERIPKILEMFADTHCNMVRVWGGGVYEDEVFFDQCDELGLMVWQDFMLGCAFYPQNEYFQNVMRKEAGVIVKKLRNHPSLALWAGDNEIDSFLYWRYQGLPSVLPSQNTISRSVLKEVVARFDPCRNYLPSSPFLSDSHFAARRDDLSPEQHLWGPRGYFKADFYAKHTALFASEIGYHGCPAKKSLEKFLSPGKVWGSYNNDEWRLHASDFTGRADSPMKERNLLMRNQIRHFFGDSVDLNDLDSFINSSQCTQAEAKKFFIEMFRSHKEKRTGIIWWNMCDGWPQFSDAVVDYYFEKKLAYDFIKRSQEPVCLMFREPENGAVQLVAVNDTLEEIEGTYRVRDFEENEVAGGKFSIPPNGISVITALSAKVESPTFYLIEWESAGVSNKNHYCLGEAPFDYPTYQTWLKKMR